MQIQLRVTGVEQAITRAVTAQSLIRTYVANDLDLWGKAVTKEMRQGHPPGGPHPGPGEMPIFGQHAYIDRTGLLTRSIDYRFDNWSNYKAVLVVFANTWYAQMVEEGTPRSRPYPFFWPVFYKNLPILMERIPQAVRLGLAEAAVR